jgi:glycosyltransferase involved in cell wall biosynthesis
MPEDKNGFLERKSKDGPLRLIYHTTPHRGLDILVACFERLVDHSDLELHLDVFSSFKIYGWDKQDQMFEDVFQKCRDHPNITYHGYQPNDVVRDALKDAHIYAYPNIWPETSCISVLEAMSAGCVVVCPNYAGLPETTANWATMYPWHEDPMQHAQLFVNLLNNIVENYWNEDVQLKLAHQKMYIDNFYNWDLRAAEWTGLLQGLIASAREIIEKSEG